MDFEMIKEKIIGIDARMIEMSGIGTYIQHLMGQGIYDYAIGNENEIRKYDENVNIIPFDAHIYGLKEQMKFPNKLIKENKIDLIHFPHYNVPVSYRGNYVVTVHDLTHIILPDFLGNKIKYCYAKYLMKQALQRAEHIFTVSENSRRDIQRFFNIPKDEISITYNAIDKEFCLKDKRKIDYLYDKYKIKKNMKIILYVGNLKPHKNLISLLRAFKKLNREDAILILVGQAFKSVDLQEQERQMGINDKVFHIGKVNKEELIDFYNLADAFVFPSLYEGFGIPPLEAMACGTPVIAANNSSIPEVVGDAAILVDGRDIDSISKAINDLFSDTDLANALIKKGLQRCKYFSWDKTICNIKFVLGSI